MKKLISAAGALCLLLSVAGCQTGETDDFGATTGSDVRGGAVSDPAVGGVITDPANPVPRTFDRGVNDTGVDTGRGVNDTGVGTGGMLSGSGPEAAPGTGIDVDRPAATGTDSPGTVR